MTEMEESLRFGPQLHAPFHARRQTKRNNSNIELRNKNLSKLDVRGSQFQILSDRDKDGYDLNRKERTVAKGSDDEDEYIDRDILADDKEQRNQKQQAYI